MQSMQTKGMKKSHKRLAVVLIFSLLCALFSLCTIAQSNPDEAEQYGYGKLDFESEAEMSADYSKSEKFEKHIVEKMGNGSGNHTSISVVDGENNNYLQFKDRGAPTFNYNRTGYWRVRTGPGFSWDADVCFNEFSAKRFDYYVFDFDIAADEYLYTYSLDGVTDSGISVPDGAEIISKKPAYIDGLTFSNRIKATVLGDPEATPEFLLSFKLVSDGADWCVYAGRSGEMVDTGARLSDKTDVWNHFTLIIKSDSVNNDFSSSTQYIYLNGELIRTDTVGTASDRFSDFSCYECEIEFPANQLFDARTLYSFGLDNFRINYYMREGSNFETDYSSLGYGLDDYFNDGNANKGIYNCEDIAYNNSYISPSPIASVDGVSYYSMNSALEAIRKDSVVRIYRGLVGYVPTLEGSFTVVAEGGVRFALADGLDNYDLKGPSSDNTYTVTYKDGSSGSGSEGGGEVGNEGDGSEDDNPSELYGIVFADAKYNLTTTTSFIGNFYVKAPAKDAGYEIYLGEGSGYVGITDIEGTSYYAFQSEPLVASITCDIVFEIKVLTSGQEEILEAKYTLDRYFSSAMEMLSKISEPTDYHLLQMKLVMNAVRYANELYRYLDAESDGYDKYEQILENAEYSKHLTSYSEFENDDGADFDSSEISSVVTGFGMEIGKGYSATYAIYVANQSICADRISLSYKTITGETKQNTLDPDIKNHSVGDAEYCYFVCSDMPIYDMLAVQKVTVTLEDGSTAEAFFNLMTYIKYQTDSSAVSLANAMYAYAKSSYSYKRIVE